MKNILFYFILLSQVLAVADIYDIPQLELIMNRKYKIKNEVAFQLGYIPTGSLAKYGILGLTYSHFYKPSHGWEMINAIYNQEIQTSLKKTLLAPPPDGYGDLVKSSDLATQKWMISTGYLLSPFYTKNLLFNSSLVYAQTTFPFSVGLASYNTGQVPFASFGVMQSFYTSPNASLKFDIRYINYFSSVETLKNNVNIVLSYGLNWGQKENE